MNPDLDVVLTELMEHSVGRPDHQAQLLADIVGIAATLRPGELRVLHDLAHRLKDLSFRRAAA